MKFDMIDWVHMFSQFQTDIWSVWLEYSNGMFALWVPSYLHQPQPFETAAINHQLTWTWKGMSLVGHMTTHPHTTPL